MPKFLIISCNERTLECLEAMSIHVLVDVWVMIISLYDKVMSCTEICSDLDGTQACPCRQKKFLKILSMIYFDEYFLIQPRVY